MHTEPVETCVESTWLQRFQLKCDGTALKFFVSISNLRHYTQAAADKEAKSAANAGKEAKAAAAAEAKASADAIAAEKSAATKAGAYTRSDFSST